MVVSIKTVVSNATFSDEIPSLLQSHLDHLKKSGISIESIGQRGYESVLGNKRLSDLGFDKYQCRTPGILIPLFSVDSSSIVSYQFRPDSPRLNSRGKPVKYENPQGGSVRLDAPPSCRESLGNPSIPVWFVEGVKKADSLASRNVCAVTLTGVWNFKGKNPLGGTTILADFDYIALKDRECYICFDSDYRDNPSVRKAAERLGEHLSRKGGKIRVVYLPPGERGEKVGVDDFLAQGCSIDDLKALAAPIENKEDEDYENEVFASHFNYNGLWLDVQKFDGSYAFAHINGSGGVALASEAALNKLSLRPRRLPEVDKQALPIVGLPDENIENARLLKPEEIYSKLKSHIKKYVDLADLDLDLCTMYVLFTWFYLKVNTVAYLRFLADTGKGKTRGKKVVGDLCFYPLYASGASSFSGIARTQQQWRGTLVIDEADFAGEKESQITKYLNLGFERGQYYILSDKLNPRAQDYFDAFSPKVLAMREPFHDNATEGRLLSITMHETSNLGIPIILSPSYYEEAKVLRNELALFALRHWNDIDATRMMSFDDLGIEPRLRQLAMPLSIIFQLWPDGLAQFRHYLIARQKEVRRVRSMSWEGTLVNLVIAIAAGDQEAGAEFSEYLKPESEELEVVTPSMVARQLKASPKAITQGLTSVGFHMEKRWITLFKEDKELRKQVRAYTIPDPQTWVEITSRYYFTEDGKTDVEIPQCLQSSKYAPSAEPSQPSQPSQKVSHQPSPVTVETLVTRRQTGVGNDGDKPAYPCPACKADKWWQRNDGGWVCGRCHPNPSGDTLLKLEVEGGGSPSSLI